VRPARLIRLLATCNVLLVVVVIWQARLLQRSSGPDLAGGAVEIGGVAAAAANQEMERGRHDLSPPLDGAMRSSSASLGPLNWREVEAADYPTYIRNLRNIGVPEQTVRDIVSADVLQGFASQRAEVVATHHGDFKFWESRSEDPEARAELNEQQREVDAAMGEVLRELLGPDVVSPSTESAWRVAELDLQLAFLPTDTRELTRAVVLRYSDIDTQIKSLGDGRRPTEDINELERILSLYDEKRAELTRLMSAEEYEQVELSISWTADNLRRAMARFDPTEQEFRSIFQAWRAHDENLVQLYATHQPDPGNAHVFEAIRELLGEERYAEYRSTWWK
jgi:hypothetical protein